ncbi:asparagine synthase C-terminal domain-containing protein [Pseudoxanthomonas composti]|uniref:asparagine synthase (glutamine-hydrolyzing) n=1 Tax=Pseudoxanthomonas composti TaxID=2137479 RepID=A0A4Q1JWR4_9GAMM|nr:asparagine synthase C-terminal domain-containing protein [Pseudoxanthomonas composti]RXR07054.1 asparagine synthase [Pseudoxanthomonas composti]
MDLGYLIILKRSGLLTKALDLGLKPVQRASGLRLGASLTKLDLFVGSSTDLLELPNGTLLVGRLFDHSGNRIRDASSFPALTQLSEIRDHLVSNFWGQYVAIQGGGDPQEPITVLRDPSGGVPCVYLTDSDPAFITSDIALPERLGIYQRRVDWTTIPYYLNYPHSKKRQTALAGVNELLPGCVIKLGPQSAHTSIAWSPWTFVQPERRFKDATQAALGIRQTVEMAVRAVTTGEASILLELSGGLDSSIIASCLRGTDAKINCSTLVTPVPGADERFYASLVASDLDAPLHVEQLDFGAAAFNFPLVSNPTSPAVTMLQQATDSLMERSARRHASTCHLSGGGGDTVFGYLGNASPAADAFRASGIFSGFTAIRDLAELHRCTTWKAGRLALKKLLLTPRPARVADTAFLTPFAVTSKPPSHPWFNAPAGALTGVQERVFDLAGTQSFIDGLPRSRLRAFHMPLLSQPVIEACLRVPSWMWIAGGINRAVARDAFSDALPPQVVARRSKGTFAHFTGALFRRNRLAMLEFLMEGELQQHGLLDTVALESFFRREHHARNETFARVFDLCMIENWIRHQH